MVETMDDIIRDDAINLVVSNIMEQYDDIEECLAYELVQKFIGLGVFDLSQFNDKHVGRYDSEDEFCNEVVENDGGCTGSDYVVIDWYATNREVMRCHYKVDLSDGTCHYFRM